MTSVRCQIVIAFYCLEQVDYKKKQEIIKKTDGLFYYEVVAKGKRLLLLGLCMMIHILLYEAIANLDSEVLFENLVELSTLSNVILVTHDTRPLRYCDEIVQISNVLNDRFS